MRTRGVRERRRGHRGVEGHARRHPALVPVDRPVEGARRLQRHRPRRLEAAGRRRTSSVPSASTPIAPSVVFVGRITRQKGLPYLLRAVGLLLPEVQIVLCAGAPDTPEILAEVTGLVEGLRRAARGRRLDRPDARARARSSTCCPRRTVFVCPSIYEPLGIVNLEAMACGIPVVGTGTGRNPRGRRRRVDRAHRPDRPGAGRHGHPDRPRQVRRGPGGDPHRGAAPTRAGSRSSWAAPDGLRASRSSAGTPIAARTRQRSTTRSLAGTRRLVRMPAVLQLVRRLRGPRRGHHPRLDSLGGGGRRTLGRARRRTVRARRRCCRSPARRRYPTSGDVEVLGTELGGADVFELRPRIGFASTALARRIPATEKVSTSC